MSQPLYFLPGIFQAQLAPSGKFVRSILNSRGLGETFADVDFENASICDVSGTGPGDKSGCVICAVAVDGHLPKVGYLHGEQTWQQVSDDLWICVDGVRPEDIRRMHPVNGYRLKLGDGNSWWIPTVRRKDGTTDLPRSWSFDNTGKFVEEVKPAHKQLYADANEIIGALGDHGVPIRPERMLELAIQLLGVNYRYSKLESRYIPIIDSENCMQVLVWGIDPKAT